MDADLKWIIGVGLGLFTTLITTMIAAFRNMAGRVSMSNRDLHQKIDRVKENYVRRDDWDKQINRLDQAIHELKESADRHHSQIMDALTRQR